MGSDNGYLHFDEPEYFQAVLCVKIPLVLVVTNPNWPDTKIINIPSGHSFFLISHSSTFQLRVRFNRSRINYRLYVQWKFNCKWVKCPIDDDVGKLSSNGETPISFVEHSNDIIRLSSWGLVGRGLRLFPIEEDKIRWFTSSSHFLSISQLHEARSSHYFHRCTFQRWIRK